MANHLGGVPDDPKIARGRAGVLPAVWGSGKRKEQQRRRRQVTRLPRIRMPANNERPIARGYRAWLAPCLAAAKGRRSGTPGSHSERNLGAERLPASSWRGKWKDECV